MGFLPLIAQARFAPPNAVLEEKASSGRVICSCNHEFSYSLSDPLNMGDYMGFVVPVCPSCKTIPESSTRRMDL
jgi:hypothetical protein